jgi:hypothetical protein
MDRPSEAKGRGWREARAVGFKDTQNEGLEGSTMLHVGMKLGEKGE